MLLFTALALSRLQDVLNRRLLFKTNRQQHQRKPSPIISSFLELQEEIMQPKFCGGAEQVVKQKPKHS